MRIIYTQGRSESSPISLIIIQIQALVNLKYVEEHKVLRKQEEGGLNPIELWFSEKTVRNAVKEFNNRTVGISRGRRPVELGYRRDHSAARLYVGGGNRVESRYRRSPLCRDRSPWRRQPDRLIA